MGIYWQNHRNKYIHVQLTNARRVVEINYHYLSKVYSNVKTQFPEKHFSFRSTSGCQHLSEWHLSSTQDSARLTQIPSLVMKICKVPNVMIKRVGIPSNFLRSIWGKSQMPKYVTNVLLLRKSVATVVWYSTAPWDSTNIIILGNKFFR